MTTRILIAVMLVLTIIPTSKTFAQDASASQLVKVHLEPIIEIAALESPNVNLGFNSISDYIGGIRSSAQTFSVHSNKDFVVSVRTNSSSFSYSGNAYPAPQMPVSNVLFLEVAENQTGGTIANSFNAYRSLSNTPRDLLLDCKNGGNQTFAVNYKATPGTDFPAGDYTVDVIYTATQP